MSGCVQVQKCGPFPRRRTFGVCAPACARTFAGFFSSSLLVVVCLGKRKERFSSSTVAVDCCLPPSREQAVAPMQRAPLPVCRQATMSETSPLTPFFIPQRCFQPLPLFKPPPSRTCTLPTFSSCGEGGESVPARSDSRVRRPAEAVFPACSCFIVIYFEKPCSSQLRVSACVYVAYVFVCACLNAYILRKGPRFFLCQYRGEGRC